MVNKKLLIGAIAIIVIVGAVASYFVFVENQKIEYQNVKLGDTCSMDILISDNLTNKTIGNSLNVINDTKHDVLIVYYNSADSSLGDILTDATQLANMRDSYKIGAEQITVGNETVWYNKDTGYYMAFLGNDDTHDNILIVNKDKEILEHLINSVKYTENAL